MALVCMCVFIWFNGIANSVVYSVLAPLSEALDLSVGDLNAGTGYLFLLTGWGLLFFQPFALQYGKRATYLISTVATLALTRWGPFAKGNGQWIDKNVLGGFFASPIEALPEMSVADVFFAHERGTHMGVYAFVLGGSNFFAPVVCGFINEYAGYRYEGPKSSMEPRNDPSAPEKSVSAAESPETESLEPGNTTYREKSYLQRLSIFDVSRKQRMPYRMWLSLRLVSWPVIFYAGFSYGSYLIWFNVLNATASVILGGAPYNFSSSMVGLSYLSCILGVIAASLYTGYLSDWLTLNIARRNKGVFEPEQRLWGFAMTTIVLPASSLLWGVGAANDVHWFGLIVAMCGTAFSNTSGITMSVNYLVDSYRDISDDGMTTVIIIRNTMSFAIGHGITPWLDNLGYQNCFISAAFIGLAASAMFLLMTWKGKSLREMYRLKCWTLVRKHIDMGMVH